MQIIVMVVNESWLQKQPKAIQDAILEGGRIATKHNHEVIMEMEAILKPAMKQAGVEILDRPDDEPLWQEKAMAIWPQLYDKIGDLELLDKIMQTPGRARPWQTVEKLAPVSRLFPVAGFRQLRSPFLNRLLEHFTIENVQMRGGE